MKQAHFVTGATASGKTKFAQNLAYQVNGAIVCADSRQLFQGFSALSNKDLPPGPNYSLSQIKIDDWNYDISYKNGADGLNYYLFDSANPQASMSVMHYFLLVEQLLSYLEKSYITPIFVGGSWLYLKTLLFPPESLMIPQNYLLRQKMTTYSLSQLQDELKKLDHSKFSALNQSDQNNPRRLLRQIEIANHSNTRKEIISPLHDYKIHLHPLFPNYEGQKYKLHLKNRIQSRLDGVLEEIKANTSLSPLSPMIRSSIGMKLCEEYLQEKITKNELLQKWTDAEYQYSRRQITFMKKDFASISYARPDIIIHDQSV